MGNAREVQQIVDKASLKLDIAPDNVQRLA